MRIAVLGGGHGCHAAAADLAEAGHEVRLWRRDARRPRRRWPRPARSRSSTRTAGARWRSPAPRPSIGAALAGAELVVIPSPATAQADIARAMAPHLESGQVVFLPPGTFGSFVMARIVRESGARAEVVWAETGTLPWLARKLGAARGAT